MANLPEPVRPGRLPAAPDVTRAAVSPAPLVVAAVGAAIGVLAGSATVAVVLAVLGWLVALTVTVGVRRRRARAALTGPAEIDPWSVPEPWRALVQQLRAAQDRLDRVLSDWPPGPMKDRLASFQPQVRSDIASMATVARRGAALTGWTGARVDPGYRSSAQLTSEMERIAEERQRSDPGTAGAAGVLERREEAVAAELRARRRAEAAAADLESRLRLAVAQLDRAVTDLIALGGEASADDPVLSSFSRLGDEVAALRAAFAETSGPPPAAPAP